MSLVHEFFTVLAEAIIPEFFRWVGTLVRWLILRNKYTMAEVYRQPWNARVGFTTILILTTVIIVWLTQMNSEASLSKSKFERKDVLTGNTAYQDGDLIFQTSLSEQSKAIQLATRSIYSHCGLIFQSDTGLMVLEAVQPVKTTPLARWIARGQDGAFVVKRLSNASQVLTPSVLARMKSLGLSFLGKNYDLEFGWSDDKIYCSELIWKIYQRTTGLEIGRLQKLKEFNLADTHVLKTLKKRYGDKIPLNEPVVSPAAVFESALLITVATR